MADASLQLEQAGERQLGDVERLLAANGLPSKDIRSGSAQFYVAATGGGVVGAGGLELYGDGGLLRSVVVRESEQGEGIGTAICAGLEEIARAEGVEVLYLLTTTAVDFFTDCGYGEVERADAPPAIRGTTQFEDLCPATAVCMRKRL